MGIECGANNQQVKHLNDYWPAISVALIKPKFFVNSRWSGRIMCFPHVREQAKKHMRYSSDITSGSLKIPESRIIADLLLRDVTKEQWDSALLDENILQARSPESAKTVSNLIRRRLQKMDAEFWSLVKDGGLLEATHACLAAAVKSSALLGDFLDLVLRDEYRKLSPTLSHAIWARYLEGCRGRDSEMPIWSDSTIDRLRSSVFQILAQSGYIESTRTLKLQKARISGKVLGYLREHEEEYVLRCIQVGR